MPTTFSQVKDAPARVSIPKGTPDYVQDYVKQVEAWGRELAAAIRQLQEKVGKLENP